MPRPIQFDLLHAVEIFRNLKYGGPITEPDHPDNGKDHELHGGVPGLVVLSPHETRWDVDDLLVLAGACLHRVTWLEGLAGRPTDPEDFCSELRSYWHLFNGIMTDRYNEDLSPEHNLEAMETEYTALGYTFTPNDGGTAPRPDHLTPKRN